MSVLVRGDQLPSNLRREVLARYPYRWTSDNPARERAWSRIEGAPTIPLVSDAQWLRDHAFYVTRRGTLDKRRTHAEPAYMTEERHSHASKKGAGTGLSAEQRDEIRAALAIYGAQLTEDDRIAKGDKVLSVRLDVKGGRLRALSGDNVLASYPASRAAAGVSDFVEKFWYWKKAAAPAGPSPAHAKKKSPGQLDREIVEALAAPTTEAARLGLRWLHVKMKHKGRDLLGTIRDVRRDRDGTLHLVVSHFNGEPWPIEPVASKVQIV